MTILGLILVLLALALVLGPVVGLILAVVILARARDFRSRAARVAGAVVDPRTSVVTEMTAMPNGAGGMTMIPGRARLRSRPVVSYTGPEGGQFTRQVRFSAAGAAGAGQRVELLVDPDRPTDVRILGAERGPAALRLVLISILVIVVDAALVGVIVYLTRP